MDSRWRSNAVLLIVLVISSSVSARVCVFGTEPDQATDGRVRAVLSSGDPCTCTKNKLGGHNKYAPLRGQPVVYIDVSYLLNADAEAIRQLYHCVAATPQVDLTSTEPPKYADCQAVFDAGYTTSGEYTIYLNDQPLQVYCRMIDNQGYIVFQRRQDGAENFQRTWYEYAEGFGSVLGEFWLGNDKLKEMTATGTWELRITLESFDGQTAIVRYDDFSITGDKYELTVDGYQSPTAGGVDAGDSLVENLRFFTTHDTDNDNSGGLNCAQVFKGGWWFKKCDNLQSNLNGEYSNVTTVEAFMGVQWSTFTQSDTASLQGCEMKMRRIP